MKARNKRYAAILSVVTVLALALSLVAVPVPSFAASTVKPSAFPDVKSTDPYANAFNALAAVGVYQGDQNGNANPSQQITRAEFAAVAVRLAGKASVANALQNQTPSFKDASQIPSWAWGSVNAASALGIIKGYPDGTFRATDNVTEAEAAAMIIRVLGNDGAAQAGVWPANYMSVAQTLGLLSGITNASANLPATRGDVAFMAYNALLATKKWDSATNSFDKDFAGLPVYYTDPSTGQPKQRTGSQLTTYGEAMGAMTEYTSFNPSSASLGGTVYVATATNLSALQNQDVYAFGPFGSSTYSALTPSTTTSVASGTVTGLTSSYIGVGSNVYPLASSVTYYVNGTEVTDQAYLPTDFVSSGNYKATLTLDSNGNVTTVNATWNNYSGLLNSITLATASSPVTTISVSPLSGTGLSAGKYDITSAILTLNGQTASASDIQTALNNLRNQYGGAAASVTMQTAYDPTASPLTGRTPFKYSSGSTTVAPLVVNVSTNTISGTVVGAGADANGNYVVLSTSNGNQNVYYGGNVTTTPSINSTYTFLLNPSGVAVATLTSTQAQSDFFATINSYTQSFNSTTGQYTTTYTLGFGDGSTATYTYSSSSSTVLGSNYAGSGEPMYVTLSNGNIASFAEYNTLTPVSGTVKAVTANYLQVQSGSNVYTIPFNKTFVFAGSDTTWSNPLTTGSIVVGDAVQVYESSTGFAGVVIDTSQ